MRVPALLLSLAAVLGVSLQAWAHDLGTTQAVAEFRTDGSYQIDITIDPDALLIKLEVAGGGAPAANLAPDERDRRIDAMAGVFLDGVEIQFDGRGDRPRFEYRPGPSGPDRRQTPGVARLTGQMPSGARAWTLNYAYVAGWFAVETRAGDAPARTDWLEGGKPGLAVPLRARSRAAPIVWRALPVVALGAVLRKLAFSTVSNVTHE